MSGLSYEDEQCVYHGGVEPRLDFEEGSEVTIRLDRDTMTIKPTVLSINDFTLRARDSDSVVFAKAAIAWVGWRKSALGIFFKSSTTSYIEGFSIVLVCQNYYHTALLAKRIAACYDSDLERLASDVPLLF